MTQKTPESRVKIVTNIFLVIVILSSISLIIRIINLPVYSKNPSFNFAITAFSLLGAAVLIFCYFLAYVRLKKMHPKARIFALWMSVGLCFSIIGIVVTWYIWKQLGYADVKALFGGQPAQPTAPPVQPMQQ